MLNSENDDHNGAVAKELSEEAKSEEIIKDGSKLGPQTLALNMHKAGMEGLDADKINEIIKKASEGSRFYQHKQKCQQRLDAKIAEMMKVKSSFSEQQFNRAVLQMDRLIEELEQDRDLTRTIVHVDMDMFYAAVEMRDDPSLRDKPMAVGSTGMLSTSNYAARKYGVRAALPGFIGKKLCPELVIVPPDFTKYKECSKAVQEVFSEYDPNFSPMSLDEAYLDITDYIGNHASKYAGDNDEDVGNEFVAKNIVKEMREKIQAKTQLTASAGIAPNTRLSKVCSDMNKPNGQYYLPPDKEKIHEFISSLPIRKVSGIGNVTEQQLSALGIKVCGDLFKQRGLLRLLFSDLNYTHFMDIALGLGSTRLEAWTERERKSLSTETTFQGTANKEFLFHQIEELCHELADDMLEKDIFGKVFTLKYKSTNFELKTRAHSFFEATRSYELLVSAARKVLQHEMDTCINKPLSLRLIGVRMSSLLSASEMGSTRQVTLTHLFSKANYSKVDPLSESSHSVCHEKDVRNNGKSNLENKSIAISHKEHSELAFKAEPARNTAMKTACIDNFLCKPGKGVTKSVSKPYECPVCLEKIHADINIHLDKCLSSSFTKDSLPSSSGYCKTADIKEMAVKVNPIGCVGDKKSLAEGYKIDARKDYPERVCENEDSLSESCQETLSCPVCLKAVFTDITLLNNHIDECLNIQAIKEISQKCGKGPKLENDNVKPSRKGFFAGLQQSCDANSVCNISQPRKKQKTVNTLEKYFNQH